jgi:hypothetical protein
MLQLFKDRNFLNLLGRRIYFRDRGSYQPDRRPVVGFRKNFEISLLVITAVLIVSWLYGALQRSVPSIESCEQPQLAEG